MMRASRAAELAAAGEIEARERLKGVQLEMEEMEDTLRQYHWFLEKSKVGPKRPSSRSLVSAA
jgi:hypothetical protein